MDLGPHWPAPSAPLPFTVCGDRSSPMLSALLTLAGLTLDMPGQWERQCPFQPRPQGALTTTAFSQGGLRPPPTHLWTNAGLPLQNETPGGPETGHLLRPP